MSTFLLAILVVTFLVLLLSLSAMLQVWMQLKAENWLLRDSASAISISERLNPESRAWLEQSQCEFVGSFRFQNVRIAVWKLPGTRTQLAAYLAFGVAVYTPIWEFFTTFGPNRELTTTNGRQAFMYPCPPGCFKESIKTKSIEELYRAHAASLALLRSRVNLNDVDDNRDYLTSAAEFTRHQARHVMTIPAWPLVLTYRFFVTRIRMYDVSIEQQMRKGLLPGIASGEQR